ncbi:MAG TPA: hypothetical protein VID48_03030 [Solirubrobacteraceae bacterium]|jgi:predicted PurR-regulated permease PerM
MELRTQALSSQLLIWDQVPMRLTFWHRRQIAILLACLVAGQMLVPSFAIAAAGSSPADKAALNKEIQEALHKAQAKGQVPSGEAQPSQEALSKLTEETEETTTVTTSSSASTASSSGSHSTLLVTALVVGVLILLAIIFVIGRDMRRVAPAGNSGSLADSRDSAARIRKRRAKAKAARRQRKRNR